MYGPCIPSLMVRYIDTLPLTLTLQNAGFCCAVLQERTYPSTKLQGSVGFGAETFSLGTPKGHFRSSSQRQMASWMG